MLSGLKVNDGTSGVWRWLTALFAGIILAGAPTMARVITLPTRADYNRIDDRSQANQLAIARVQEQLLGEVNQNTVEINALTQAIMDLKDQIKQLRIGG